MKFREASSYISYTLIGQCTSLKNLFLHLHSMYAIWRSLIFGSIYIQYAKANIAGCVDTTTSKIRFCILYIIQCPHKLMVIEFFWIYGTTPSYLGMIFFFNNDQHYTFTYGFVNVVYIALKVLKHHYSS